MKKGFTLIEMLVAIGIIAILIVATTMSYGKLTKSAEKARAQELVSEVATALTAIWDTDGVWPKRWREHAGDEGGILLDKDNALILAKRGGMSFSAKKKVDSLGNITEVYALTGKDRFGVVTPWAEAAIKRSGDSASEDTSVTGSTTVKDHILRFAIDLDGDGIVENAANGVKVRATAAVWCIDKEGKTVTSWTVGQTRAVE